jgi:hypothetical protein
MKAVKWVEEMGSEELANCKLWQSIRRAIPSGNSSNDYVMVLSKDDGELEELKIEDVCATYERLKDAFSDDRIPMFVKLHHFDGTWEYGFKLWRNVAVVQAKNKVLHPIYLMDGRLDKKGNLTNAKVSEEMQVPMWMNRLLERYNEKIRDKVLSKDKSVETDDATIADWEKVIALANSPYCGGQTMEVDKTTKRAVRVDIDSRRLDYIVYRYYPDFISLDKKGEPIDKGEQINIPVVKTAYTYLNRSVKSFCWGEAFVQHLHDAGFRNEHFTPLSLGIATIYTAIK